MVQPKARRPLMDHTPDIGKLVAQLRKGELLYMGFFTPKDRSGLFLAGDGTATQRDLVVRLRSAPAGAIIAFFGVPRDKMYDVE